MGQDHNHSNLALNLAAGIAFGALAGLAIGLLLAPKPGSQTRRLVKDALATGLERLQESPAVQETEVR